MKENQVLIVTDKNEPSATKVIDYLQEMDTSFFRLDVSLMLEIQSKIVLGIRGATLTGYIQSEEGTKIDLETVKSVWFRKPKPISIFGKTSVVERKFIEGEFKSSLWSLYTCLESVYWMNHPLYALNLLEHNKLFQLKLAVSVGLAIPDTIVTNKADELIGFCEKHNGFIAVKAVRSQIFQEDDGSAIGIYTNKVSIGYLKNHVNDIGLAPVMAQEYIEKKLELRITIVGKQVFTCAIHSQDSERTKYDWRRYDFANVKHEPYELPGSLEFQLLDFMKRCNLSFGAIDMILTPKDRYIFLEVNPNGQFGWIENLANLPISRTIAKTLRQGRD